MTETPTATSPITREVVLTIPRKYDIEIHVSKAKIDDSEYADIREYVVSLQQYGRGIVLPVASLYAVAEALHEIDMEHRQEDPMSRVRAYLAYEDEEPLGGDEPLTEKQYASGRRAVQARKRAEKTIEATDG